jgi:phage tail-like protein
MSLEQGYLYLNTEHQWPDAALHQLALEPDGTLRLAHVSANTFAASGIFQAGPFQTSADSTHWFRLRVYAEALAERTQLQLFTYTSDDAALPFEPTPETQFTTPGWQALPLNSLEGLIRNAPARHLWVGGILSSDGQDSPRLRQIRVEYGRDTYLPYLPAIYGQGESRRDFLERFLSLHESGLSALEEMIDDLPQLFDPLAAPDEPFPSWLAWLAGWLAFDLNEVWSEAETRRYLAQAFALYGQRGTLEGLRRYLKLYAGVEAHITEPAQHTHLWALGETSSLGMTTMLAPAQVQGAVVGTSATLDQSHLTQREQFGAALFEDLAHRFCVQVYRAELSRPGALADVHAVLDREKPAHTSYHLCVIEPRMQVGVQSRVGIDAIVGQGPPLAQVGMVLDSGVLSAAPPDPALRVGIQSRTGIDAIVAHGRQMPTSDTDW